MPELADHPLRRTLSDELHARPSPPVPVPADALYIALTPADAIGPRDRTAERAHLAELLARYGLPAPPPGATHFTGQIGDAVLKWESHAEAFSYTIISPRLGAVPFSPEALIPAEWLASAPGLRLVSACFRVEEMPETEAGLSEKLSNWFVAESLAAAWVIDHHAIAASDFRLDAAGHTRFALFVEHGTGTRRVGRLLQRLCEIELYATLSLLGFAAAQRIAAPMAEIDARLTAIVSGLATGGASAEETLGQLLSVSSELEGLIAGESFRFGATGAYEAIVHHRVTALREERIPGYQTFAEFMQRRYEPAMRTARSAEKRLTSMADRAERAGDLLRTRVDVGRSAQSQALLASMDRRSDQQLRLQHTVEGLSIAAISYYAVSLASYLLLPFAEMWHLPKSLLTAGLVPVIMLGVALTLRRIRAGLHD
ncbi:hypothetical protein CG51_02430 [Haematobacter missouriensis]|uniref:DUF3422 domain-containing protein n=1 Tax=Haematobacter missouriensis TaxID=366616 RepID=A0A212AMY4_9RHOB|nr:DUF3422 domain-containing protein [Haematobacter missouriensis]KFI32381.1 hypothetical protein CG51_02430 [Haematobacter missouriensis]OWJ71091.1 hypothetical protein CDV53_19500 [Haematobacter missouriensis]OWJ82793.1 hypothetical protein CDV52_12335 [Haematobacter missouriensis]